MILLFSVWEYLRNSEDLANLCKLFKLKDYKKALFYMKTEPF